jgi:hypothetical protein
MLNDDGIGIIWSHSAGAAMDAAFGSSMEGMIAIEAGLRKLFVFSEITTHSLPNGGVAVVRARLLADIIDVQEVEVVPVWAIKALLTYVPAQRGSLLTPP